MLQRISSYELSNFSTPAIMSGAFRGTISSAQTLDSIQIDELSQLPFNYQTFTTLPCCAAALVVNLIEKRK